MKVHPKSILARSMMLAALSTCSIAAQATDVAGFQVGGHLDLYYQYDFGRPGSQGSTVNYRQFDVTHNQFSLAVLEVNVSRAPTKDNPYGITINLVTGKNADITNSTEPGGDSYKYLQQAYVTYQTKGGDTIDFGKFLTPIGYETIVSADNDNYSRSFLFTFGEPLYHMGVRYNKTLTKTLSGALHLVNGWNEVEDSNAGKTYGAMLTYTGIPNTSITANYMGGSEGSSRLNSAGSYGGIGFAAPGTAHVDIADLVATYQATPKVKLALNADYASAKAIDNGDPSGKWRGIAGYVRYQATPTSGATIRYETFSDPDSLRTGANSRLNSLTGTLDFQTSKDAVVRIEVRYDKANLSVFNKSDGKTTDNRTTVSLSHVLRF